MNVFRPKPWRTDVAGLLASERFGYTTGDIITIDGGLSDAFPRSLSGEAPAIAIVHAAPDGPAFQRNCVAWLTGG